MMSSRLIRDRLTRFAVGCWSDTSGAILPYVTVALVAIIGLSLLALDGARYMGLQSQLQGAADALALAGAAELDGLPDAEVRAVNAINTLIANSTLPGLATSRKVEVQSVQFYSDLPASDASPLSTVLPAGTPLNARFVAVALKPISMTTILPAALFGGPDTVRTSASAVAGFDQVVCDVTPLFVCNPFETEEMSYEQATRSLQLAASNPSVQRRLIRMRQNGGDTRPYGPADYGFLDSPTLVQTNAALVDAVARTHRNACFRRRSVNLRPGRVPTVGEGFNVRFDIYAGSMVGSRADSNYPPAENVRKGFAGGGLGENACAAYPAAYWPIGAPPNQATGLPLDLEWPYLEGRMGNGNWDFATYWQVNHGSSGRVAPTVGGEPASNSNQPSRYKVYRYEIDQGYVDDVSPGGERGTPACYSGGALPGTPDRRILQAAVVNCLSVRRSESLTTNIPVAAFGKFFLTLPLMPSQTDLYVEIVGLVVPGDGTLDFETVQLYR
jgi:Flp pilus assembly protein TadG